ncbi:hypothetical protein PYW08_012693 [Mythimna loreyi]|uniref:Uncharacterized protein n=1 Tax=Mythimna loreyi TaxID=667449 RepID=A0ACC2Q0V2_9NEOP|nr:hypothetical protein PYW08_012693 [Mythimna loreyi]
MDLFVSATFIYLMHFASYGVVALPTVPVFMIDYEQVMAHIHIDPNPFEKMSSSKFSDIINDSARRSTGVIIFVEKRFSIEDISTKDTSAGTPYKNLHGTLTSNRETLKYFPCVIEPYKVLLKAFPQTTTNVHYLAQNSKLRLKDNFKHLYILFQDGPRESKIHILRRHDTVIKEVMTAARRLKAGPVLAFYTGKENPVDVPRVEYVKNLPNAMSRKSGILLISPYARLRIFGLSTGMQTRRAIHSETPTVSLETRRAKGQNSKFKFNEFEMEWTFEFEQNHWKIVDIVMYEGQEEVGRAAMNVICPYQRSYYCTEPIRIVNTRSGDIVKLSEILVEPKDNLSSNVFSKSIHCLPFFNGTVLSSLFVVYLLLGILSYGIIMMCDCSNNDRYEDPEGKPLTHEQMH